MENLSFESRVLHAEGHDYPYHTHTFPIFQTSAFIFDSPEHGRALFAGEVPGHIYSRLANPTVETLEKMLANLEQGKFGLCFGSGMSATMCATMPFLKNGDSMIIGDTLYGCTVDLFIEHYPKYGIETIPTDTSSIASVKAAIRPNTRIIYLETPANPTNKVSDIEEISKIAREINAMVIVDSTFASPYFQKPLTKGADIVLHSMTKYIGGHGDLIAGCLVMNSEDMCKKIASFRKVQGGILGPFDAFLVLRGIRTLPIRMDRIQENSMKVARYLQQHKAIEKVLYPGLDEFVGREIIRKQMSGVGGTFSFTMKGGYEAAKRLLENVRLMVVAVSLGTCDTLIQHPASMTHACVPEDLMKKQGLTPNMIRISVGLENPDEIIQDFEQAFAKL